MSSRAGSFLIVCISLMVLMIVLAFSILHDLRQQVDTSTGNQRYLLAESAARSGLDHALTQIITDYDRSSMAVRSGSGPVTVPAFTFLDGPYRAPFVSLSLPNTVTGWLEGNSPSDDNDVRLEDSVLRPFGWWWFENGNWYGNQMYDGRGRYYEPGYYNLKATSPGTDGPVQALPILSLNAALPERAQSIFYDEQFRRIPSSGNPQLDRKNARYRLRYAVGVEDLSGHILINPLPDMNMLSGLPSTGNGTVPVDYRTPAVAHPWMTTAINTLADLAGNNGGGVYGSQCENVFQGRGYYCNIDLDHTPSGINGPSSGVPWPKTFPLMYRSSPHAGQGGDCWSSWVDNSGNLIDNLYYSQSGKPMGLAIGGEVLPPACAGGGGNFWPYPDAGPGLIMHCLMGPQLSFENFAYAAGGETAYLNNPEFSKFAMTPFGRGLSTSGYIPYAKNKWYQGRIDTPFYINLMTAPPTVISSMLYGYIQPWIKTYSYTSVSWYVSTGTDPATGWQLPGKLLRTDPINANNPANQAYGYGRDLMVNTTAPPAFAQWSPPDRKDGNPVGARNPPGAAGQIVSPDYYAVDPRSPVAMYPGPFMNGDAANPGQGGDDLGKNMDEVKVLGQFTGSGERFGFDPYTWPDSINNSYFLDYSLNIPQTTWGQFMAQQGGNQVNAWNGALNWATEDPVQYAPPVGWGGYGGQNSKDPGSDYLQKNIANDMLIVNHTYSYYFDLIGAMAQAIATFRAEYIQYSNVFFSINAKPGTYGSFFGTNDPQPGSYQNLRDLDRLFLAEIGESLDAPGSGPPAALQLTAFRPTALGNGQFTVPFDSYIPKNNIWSLVKNNLLASGTLTSIQRAHVMELMLNDFRMSFFGSSPAYSDVIDTSTGQPDAAKEFRPLDFLGDGHAYCSCFATTDNDPVYPLPCAPAGTKPPTYFTITGAFFIGKSHFYRVFSRGEVWDNLLNHKTDEATLDSVISVDPEGDNTSQTQFLYQRWLANRYQAMLPAIKR